MGKSVVLRNYILYVFCLFEKLIEFMSGGFNGVFFYNE